MDQLLKQDETYAGDILLEEQFTAAVVQWYYAHGRAFPWRETTNPYHLLLAETLLRQTQAVRVVEPYLELVGRYPDPWLLALANIPKLREWFGPLGLVTRADRLVKTARVLIEEYEGQMPNDLTALLALPGLGRYSARAILCLGFGVRVPMIDEGSGRTLRRVLGREHKGPAFSDRSLMATVEQIMSQTSAREFNLGLLDIAAAYCRPRKPDCARCPVRKACALDKAELARPEETRGASVFFLHLRRVGFANN